jgi:glutamate carboxypeptidase
MAVAKDLPQTQPKQLLLGHVDTVWPHGTLETMPVESKDGCLHGPGVYDMKGGLVQAVFALSALRELGLQPAVTPVFFMNSDEEIGSRESAHHIVRLAKIVDRAMIMEPSLGPSGQLKTTRKGVGRFIVQVRGKAAHAGLNPEKGISAILELSHVVQALFALNDPERGITVNVGTIDGGMRPNVVAPQSRAEVDVRVRTHEDAAMIEKAIHSLEPSVPGTELQIEGRIGRPPLEATPRNRRLWNRAQEAAGSLGIELDEGAAGGGSDGNWTSLYTATLDGLGAVGDGAHAVIEHVVEEKMPERAALLACLILGEPIMSAAESEATEELEA